MVTLSILYYILVSISRIPMFILSLVLTPFAYVLRQYRHLDIVGYWLTEENPPEWFTRTNNIDAYDNLIGIKKFWIYYKWTALRNYAWGFYNKYGKVAIKEPFYNTFVVKSNTEVELPGNYTPQLRFLDKDYNYSAAKGKYINWYWYYPTPYDLNKVTVPGVKIIGFIDLNNKYRFLYTCIRKFKYFTISLRFGWNPYDGLITWHSKLIFSYR